MALPVGEQRVIGYYTLAAGAAAFYRKYGFTPLPDNRLHLYLPVATIEQALG